MIPAEIPAAIATLKAAVDASTPIEELTPLQLKSLVDYGRSIVAMIDAAIAATGAVLDGPDPSGHPLAIIAGIRARRDAAADATKLADLRGLMGRAVLNLSAGQG